jgi:hypothetical protein
VQAFSEARRNVRSAELTTKPERSRRTTSFEQTSVTEAVRQCRTSAQVQTYFRELVSHLEERGEHPDAEDVAVENVSRTLKYFAPTVRQRWHTALPDLFPAPS